LPRCLYCIVFTLLFKLPTLPYQQSFLNPALPPLLFLLTILSFHIFFSYLLSFPSTFSFLTYYPVLPPLLSLLTILPFHLFFSYLLSCPSTSSFLTYYPFLPPLLFLLTIVSFHLFFPYLLSCPSTSSFLTYYPVLPPSFFHNYSNRNVHSSHTILTYSSYLFILLFLPCLPACFSSSCLPRLAACPPTPQGRACLGPDLLVA
jgi:hypothetical protein